MILLDRQCFIRAELLEVIRTLPQDAMAKDAKNVYAQKVGIRCRFCAHVHPGSRAPRSSAFPSSIRQMYQSFAMMVSDHFRKCEAIPLSYKRRFDVYQVHLASISPLSKDFWAYSAQKLGMVNASFGITITEESIADARLMPPFRCDAKYRSTKTSSPVEPLVLPEDQPQISPYLYTLMSLVQICHLSDSDRNGKRKDAPLGLPGFGCQVCCQKGRLGFCRVFPLKKKSLYIKINDLYGHLMRCPNIPRETKARLKQYKQESQKGAAYVDGDRDKIWMSFSERDRNFLARVWFKSGRGTATVPA